MTSVLIYTNTPGAKVYVDGNYVGDTQGSGKNAEIQVNVTNKANTIVKIEKDDKSIIRTLFTELKAVNLIGGLFLLVPFVWIVGPVAFQTINLFD